MGELNRDLNLSSIHHLEYDVSFSPNASPVRSFKTPIQQIVSSKYIPDHQEQHSHLAVRTFEMTSVMKVTATDDSKHSAQVAELGCIVQSDTGHRAIVDITLIPRSFEALAITDNGALYNLNTANGHKTLSVVSPASSADTELPQDAFWRIALGENGLDCLIASSKGLKMQDFRSRASLDLFTISRQQDVLTSIDHGGDNIIRLCSTREIIWMDKRYPNKPLLGHQHGRQYDRSLEARTIQLQPQLTLLTSRNNVLVTVYDVSRSAGQLVHMASLPYCLFPDEGFGTSCIGSVFLQHTQNFNENVCLVRLSDDGSLNYVDLAIPRLGAGSVVNTSWSADVKELDAQTRYHCPDVGPLGAQDFSETDFRLPYHAIFRVYAEEQFDVEEENGEAVYDLLDQIPNFWQNSDAPVESMLTLFDAAFRSGLQPTQASRADFLTQSIINSKRGYRALVEDRLSARCIMKGAAWHHNITPTINHLGLSVADNIRSCAEALHRYDLTIDPERDVRSVRWENEAREQLALDLALSVDVFSEQPFSAFPDESSELEAMTKTLSLASESPGVNFGYLRPFLKSSAGHYRTTTEEDEVVSFSGVRALLKDWVVGTDPYIPSGMDHSDGKKLSDSGTLPSAGEAGRNAKASQGFQVSSYQRPPLVVASTIVPPSQIQGSVRGTTVEQSQVPGLPRRFGLESQPMPIGPEPPESSQEHTINTQILLGPYGGRPSLGKKMGKKRLGGF